MQHTLNVRAFFFNAQTDYLPYYKNFTMTLADDAKAVEILKEIKAQNENFAYPEEKLIFKVNELVVTGEESVGKIVERLGNELLIEPVLSYRSNHCLVINDDDFMQRFELLAPYATDEDKAYYESLYAQHYASESLKFSHEYIGDAILLLAHRMISSGSEHKEEILAAINDPYEGLNACEFENNLFNGEDHTATIEALHAMYDRPAPNKFLEKVSRKLSKEAQAAHKVERVNGLGVAFYQAHENKPSQEEVFDAIERAGANVVRFSREKRLSGRSLIGRQENLAYLKAATTLLEALDSGADVLVVANKEDLDMFNKHFAAIQKRIGREIPLALLSFSTFKTLAQKEKVA
jgi:succinate dehydrogenase/fumarate reductase-like Fe-S protein